MKRNVFVLAWLGGLLFFAGSGAPPLAQSGSQSLSEQAVVLFPPRLPDGLSVGNLFADWRITLTSDAGSAPISSYVTVAPLNSSPFQAAAIVNDLSGEHTAGMLTIRFALPVRRAALMLGAETLTTSIATAFDLEGAVVDELIETTIGGPTVQHPKLNILDAGEDREIHRIDVAYTDPSAVQILFMIIADFVEPPSFQRCIPQIAHGSLPHGRRLRTRVSIANPGPLHIFRTPQAIADFSLDFFNSSGASLSVELNGEIASQLTGTLALQESKLFSTTEAVSASGLDAGYACLTSNYPLELAAVFRVLDESGGVVAEAGIDGQRPGHRFVGLLEKDPIEETNTALALANVSELEATAAVSFFLAPNTTFTAEVVLGPGEHGSWFADELSSQLADRDAVGTVEILSDQPIVGTILRTIRGVVSASLPLNRQRAADEE